MRRLLRTLAITILGLAVLVILAFVFLATPPGRSLMAGLIERAASANGLTVKIEGLSGWPPFSLGADHILVSDADGVFAEANAITIDPKVFQLLTGNLAFDMISAGRIAIQRAPKLPGGNGTEGALLAFAADNVSVARLELGADLAGRPAVLALTGSFASGIDGQRGVLVATLSRRDAGAPLSVNVDLSEGADGVLVGLMGRMSGPGYTLAATMGVTGDALEGDLRLASEGSARFDGRFTLSPIGGGGGGGHRLELTGAGNLAELVPPEYGDLLAGPVDIAIDADWAAVEGQPLPRLVIRQGTFTSNNVRATASGALGEPGNDLALTVDIAKADGGAIAVPGLAAPTRFDTLSLKGKVAPVDDVLRLDLTGNARGLRVGDTTAPGVGLSLAVEARRDQALGSAPIPFDLRVEADTLETPAGRLDAAGGAPLTLSAGGSYDPATMVADTRLHVIAAGGAVDFAGSVAADAVTGDATVRFDDLASLAPLARRPLGGSLNATASGTFFGPAPSITVEATTTNLDVGDPTIKRLAAGATRFSGVAQRGTDNALSFSDVAIRNAAFDATGSVTLTAAAIDAALNGTIADLAVLADASTGAATFNATATGALARPTIDATISIPSGRLLNQPVENAVVTVKGAPADGSWSGALSLAGSFAGRPLTGTADAALGADGLLAFPAVDLTVGDNRITGSLQRTADGLLSGELAVDAPHLATLAALALIQADGAARANLRFTPDGTRQTITASFTGTDIVYGPIAAGSVSGEAQIDDAFGVPLVRGNATGSAVAVGGVNLSTARVTATVENGATRFQASARGPDLNLTGSGSLSGANGAQVVRIDTLDGTAFRFPVKLNTPVAVTLGDQSRLAGATLALGGGTVRVDGVVSPALNLTVVATNVSASVINGFAADLGAEGTISGRATVTGAPANPNFAWQVDWAGLRTTQTRNAGLPGLTVAARGSGTRSSTSLNGTLAGAGVQLTLAGQVPFAGSGLNVTANGTVPLSLLALESQRELRLGGNARVAIAVTGSIAAPGIAGTVDLTDATIADTDSGFGVTGATGRIDFDGTRATIRQISGRMVQGGTLTLAGTVATASAGLPADLTLRVTNGRYSDGSVVNTNFNADLTITGPLLGAGVVSGQIKLGRTEIQLPDRLSGSANAIDVRHINAAPGFVPPQPRLRPGSSGGTTVSAGGGGLRLDIALTADSGVYVRGFGIDAELGGTLRVAGSTGNPQAIGGLELQRGRIEALGRRFDFTRGQLTFSGSIVPVVDFSATTSTADAVVTLNVIGPANDPQIHFTSSPDMSEEEILSRLLFQRGVGALSPLQALQLVDAVAQLTGAIGQGGIFARIRQATGLDDLDIRQSATGGTTVGLGRRINENLRLGVEAGTDAGSGRVVIDLDITKNLKAQAQAGQDGSGKIGLTYEREY